MLIRKIKSIGCWNPDNIRKNIKREDATFQGDSIADLKTEHNGLSVWFTPDLEEESLKPILAAMAVSRDSLQKITYVVLDEKELERLEIYAEQVNGIAPGVTDKSILNRHRDLTDIDYKRMGMLSEYICSLIKMNKGTTLNIMKMKNYINDLISQGSIDKNSLKESIKQVL